MKFGIYDIKNFINLTNPKRSLNVSLLFSKYDTTFDVIYPGKNASVVFGINNEYIVEKISAKNLPKPFKNFIVSPL